jgi:hypothetical protein
MTAGPYVPFYGGGYGYGPYGYRYGNPYWRRRWRGYWPLTQAAAGYGLIGLGETSSWLGILTSTDDVYIWRVRAKNVELTSPAQALLFARAVGLGQNRKLDVRGVAVRKEGSDDWTIDVVLTSSEGGISVGVATNADGVAQNVLQDSQVRAAFPQLQLKDPKVLELTGPKDAITHWRSQPLLWDHLLGSDGGPTETYGHPAEYSVVKGRADDGKSAEPWLMPKSQTEGDGKPPGPLGNTLLLVGLAVIGGYAVVQATKDKRKRN